MSCRVARQNLIDTRPERALVLFSGGQDSTTCLAWTLSRFAAVETIGFDYRQRHRVELQCRASVLETLRSEFTDWNGTANFMAAHGLPLIPLLLPIAALVEIVGGLAILLGVRTRAWIKLARNSLSLRSRATGTKSI